MVELCVVAGLCCWSLPGFCAEVRHRRSKEHKASPGLSMGLRCFLPKLSSTTSEAVSRFRHVMSFGRASWLQRRHGHQSSRGKAWGFWRLLDPCHAHTDMHTSACAYIYTYFIYIHIPYTCIEREVERASVIRARALGMVEAP